MTRDEYRARLREHDWYYHFSDDPRVYHAGESESKLLIALAGQNSEFQEDYRAVTDYLFSGKSFGTSEISVPDWWEIR